MLIEPGWRLDSAGSILIPGAFFMLKSVDALNDHGGSLFNPLQAV